MGGFFVEKNMSAEQVDTPFTRTAKHLLEPFGLGEDPNCITTFALALRIGMSVGSVQILISSWSQYANSPTGGGGEGNNLPEVLPTFKNPVPECYESKVNDAFNDLAIAFYKNSRQPEQPAIEF